MVCVDSRDFERTIGAQVAAPATSMVQLMTQSLHHVLPDALEKLLRAINHSTIEAIQ